jgi:hypothetical protein
MGGGRQSVRGKSELILAQGEAKFRDRGKDLERLSIKFAGADASKSNRF